MVEFIFLSISSKWGISLKKIGQVLHIGPGNKAIAKVENPPKIGETVFSFKKKPIGTVLDVFGPVKSPYIEIEVRGLKPEKIVNYPLYVSPRPKHLKKRKRRK